MFLVEILALCGIAQVLMTSFLFAPLRANMPTKALKYAVTKPQCTGFLVGFIAYATVALCGFTPGTDHSFPMAAAVASVTNVYAQWTLAFVLGGLIAIGSVLLNHFMELIYFAKTWLVLDIAVRQDRRRFAQKVFEDDDQDDA